MSIRYTSIHSDSCLYNIRVRVSECCKNEKISNGKKINNTHTI